MAMAFVMRKRFRVAQLHRLATTIRMRPTTTAHVPKSMFAAFAEAMASRLALAIVRATCSTRAVYAVATAYLLVLAIVKAMSSMPAAYAEATASLQGLVIAPATCWMPVGSVVERG